MSVMHRLGLAGVLGVVVVLGAGLATAGDCPECQTAADCPRNGSFCVRHNGSVGCGALVQLCCPGQACGLGMDGRPTCEARGTCTVVTGPTDAGSTATDSGTATDAGAAATDTGTAVADVPGGAPPAGSSAACSVRAGGGASTGRSGFAALAFALAVAGLRRRGLR